ncbi:MAG: manganese efflux pump [Akkermansia sp.]|nr:manganese efflux pump [Akkermansia sp.]
MNIAEIAAVGAILAVDATVYSFSYGLILRERRLRSSLLLALTVGGYQALMPLLGYLGGTRVRDVVDAWDHWIVLAVFCLLGGSIIYKTWCSGGEDEEAAPAQPLAFVALMIVGIATSIDALAVGVCMALGDIGGKNLGFMSLLGAVAIIGVITFVASAGAFHSARMLHRLPTQWLETAAGFLLIALGIHNVLRELFCAC